MIELQGRKLCENCFSEITESPCPCCGFMTNQPITDPTVLQPGSILNGKYVIGKVIGKGGFGITYLAYDTQAGRKEAIKEFFPFGLALRSGNPTVSVTTAENASVFKSGAERFYDEARLVSRFNGNPNIVGVHEFFYENDTVYFSMEYLEGQTLKSYIEKNGVLSPEQTLFIAQNMSNALMAAHSAAVLHRDISPDNIMLCSNGEVKLIDFGAARQVVAEHSQSFSVILKPGFAPLEQYQKKGNQGTWTDIYSLGASLYYALTGDIPDDPMSRMEDDTTFQTNKFSIEQQMWDIITKATQLRISDRYPDVFELRKALNSVAYKPEPIIAVSAPAAVVGFRTAMPFGSNMRSTANSAAAVEETPKTASEQRLTAPEVQTVPTVDRVQTVQSSQTMQTSQNEQNVPSEPIPIQPKSAESKPHKKLVIGAVAGGVTAVVAAAVIIALCIGGSEQGGSVPVKNDNPYSQEVWNGGGTVTHQEESVPPEPDKDTSRETTPKTTTTKKPENSKPESEKEPDLVPETVESKTDKESKSDEESKPSKETETTATTTTTTAKSTPKPDETTTTKATTPKQSEPEEITSIKIAGKSYSVDLTSLSIDGMGLMDSDLKDIKYMTKLESLVLSNNNLTSIKFVKNMPNLKHLYIHNNEVSDISALKSLKKLEGFGANGNPISDISALSGLTKLTNVWLNDTKVKDISALSGKNLIEAGFNNCSISGSASVFSDMSKLKKICLAGCGLTDISFLADKPNLAYIYLGDNSIAEYWSLYSCESIKELYIDYNPLTNDSCVSFFSITVDGIISAQGCGLTDDMVDYILTYLRGNIEAFYY